MKKGHWDEQDVEILLKQAPKIKDNRSKEEIFQRLLDEGAFDEKSPQLQKTGVKTKGIRWIPLITSIASLFLIVVFAMQFIDRPSSSESALEHESKEVVTEGTLDIADNSAKEERLYRGDENTSFSIEQSLAEHTLVYESQLQGITVFTIGLVGDGGESIPASFLIPNEIVREKLGTASPTKLQLYEAFSPLIDEEGFGFNEYHPFKGKLLENDEEIIQQLPEKHLEDASIEELANYTNILKNTFNDAYERVNLEDVNGSKIKLETKEVNNPITIRDSSEKHNYFTYQMGTGAVYLIPNYYKSYSTVEEALKDMTAKINDKYQTVILQNVTYSVKKDHDVVIVKFDHALDLQQFDMLEAMRMIEGIIMTAAQFDQQVKFEQIVQEEWNGFDFTKPLEKPIAANVFYF